MLNNENRLMKTPIITSLALPNLIQATAKLPLYGQLAKSTNNLIYLDINDNYIHQLYPLLNFPGVIPPNYFNQDGIGAHISIIYPEEHNLLMIKELGASYHFTLQQLVSAQFAYKTYYVLLVESAPLVQLRRDYNLPNYLNFKGYKINFHITIGKSL
ncbi:hypothetical protein ACNVED_09595 [Legionella sp. D16C41]|uniref:hypothetical protein n=1 Tax=Legionella sp. D16C41 TaxID=3402688 RepID=UPI003AF98ECB